MAGYLFCDGFTSTLQEKMFHGYDMSTNNQMLYVNMFSAFLSFAGLFLSGQLGASLAFSSKYPDLFVDAFWLSVTVMCGQQVLEVSTGDCIGDSTDQCQDTKSRSTT
jgi:adenosine 3'-phospho 5'-phosphosulfate transporter B2